MRVYLVIKNEFNVEIGEYPIDTRNELSKEVARILIDEQIVLNYGDIIFIESR